MKLIILKSLVFLFSSFAMAKAFDGKLAIGLIGQFSGNFYFFSNSDLKITFKNEPYKIKEYSLLHQIKIKDKIKAKIIALKEQEVADFKVTGADGQIEYTYQGSDPKEADLGKRYNVRIRAINKREAWLKEEYKKLSLDAHTPLILDKQFSFATSAGIKFMTSISKKWLLDISAVAKKDIGNNIQVNKQNFQLNAVEDFFKNITGELCVGFLYNIKDLNDKTSVYAGVGAAISYNLIDRRLKSQIKIKADSDNKEIESIIDQNTEFNSGNIDGGIYGNLQLMYKATDYLLIGTGIKLHGNFFHSPFGNVDSINDIKNTKLIETGISGSLYITYLI